MLINSHLNKTKAYAKKIESKLKNANSTLDSNKRSSIDLNYKDTENTSIINKKSTRQNLSLI